MTAITRRERWLDPFDWLEHMLGPTGWRGWTGFGFRIEDEMQENAYVLRAELPGIDPDKDVEISLAEGMLTVAAERREQTAGTRRSEFRYGTMSRTISLPAGADEEHITARYADGILEITIPIHKETAKARTIPVSRKS